MRKNSPEYRLWKKRQDAKKLKRRTKRKKKKKAALRTLTNYNQQIKKRPEYNETN